MEVFEYGDIIQRVKDAIVFHRFSVFMWTDELKIRTPLSVDREKRGKKFRFQKYPNACGRGLNVSRERTLNFGLWCKDGN